MTGRLINLTAVSSEAHSALKLLQSNMLTTEYHGKPLTEVYALLETKLVGRTPTINTALLNAGADLTSVVQAIIDETASLASGPHGVMPAGMAGMILLGLQSIAKSLWFGTIKFSLQYTVLTFPAQPCKVTSKCNCAQVIANHARYPARTRLLDFASGICSHSELE